MGNIKGRTNMKEQEKHVHNTATQDKNTYFQAKQGTQKRVEHTWKTCENGTQKSAKHIQPILKTIETKRVEHT